MKALFLLLLFINISVALWHRTINSAGANDVGAAEDRINSSIETIVLVSETQGLQKTPTAHERRQIDRLPVVGFEVPQPEHSNKLQPSEVNLNEKAVSRSDMVEPSPPLLPSDFKRIGSKSIADLEIIGDEATADRKGTRDLP